MHAISECLFDCLVSALPLSAAFLHFFLTEKPYDCVEKLVCLLVLTSNIAIPGYTAPVQSSLRIPKKCTSHKLVLLPLCCLCTASMASI